MMRFATLMYHAIYDGEKEFSLIDQVDRPYAISKEVFCSQLDLLSKNKIDVLSPELIYQHGGSSVVNTSVVLTFDDGHASFYHHAYPELRKRNMAAIFFVTTDLVIQREDFCNWTQLTEMHQGGMSIQSHGKTHRFLSDLDESSAHEELLISRKAIEKEVGNKVIAISFPGGRYGDRDIRLGKKTGYELFFTSDIGTGKKGTENNIVPRLALRGSTSNEKFLLLAKGSKKEILGQLLISFIKKTVKFLLGNKIYHELYRRIAAR